MHRLALPNAEIYYQADFLGSEEAKDYTANFWIYHGFNEVRRTEKTRNTNLTGLHARLVIAVLSLLQFGVMIWWCCRGLQRCMN